MTVEATLDERIDFLFDMTRLQLWFCRRRLADHPAEDLRAVLRDRVDIYRFTDLYDGRDLNRIDWDADPWRTMEDRLADLHDRTAGDEASARFENEGLAIVADRIAAYARDRHARGWLSGLRGHFPHGAIRFDPPKPDRPGRVGLHIANVISPRSIFDDPAYLPGCLRRVMDLAQHEHGVEALWTCTWLNSYRPWLEVFGPEWAANMLPPLTEVTCGKGWWGQFVNARGTFNRKHADLFRRTGVMPFLPRESWCDFEALRSHLDTLGH